MCSENACYAWMCVLSLGSVALSLAACNPVQAACRITLEAPPVRSWAVDGLLDSLVAPTLPAADKAERARRQADWERQATATTKVICDVRWCEASSRRQSCARSLVCGHVVFLNRHVHLQQLKAVTHLPILAEHTGLRVSS